MKIFIVWNEDKSEGYATTDEQLAYEVRKSADTNCLGLRVAIAFCDTYYLDNCTIQEVNA